MTPQPISLLVGRLRRWRRDAAELRTSQTECHRAAPAKVRPLLRSAARSQVRASQPPFVSAPSSGAGPSPSSPGAGSVGVGGLRPGPARPPRRLRSAVRLPHVRAEPRRGVAHRALAFAAAIDEAAFVDIAVWNRWRCRSPLIFSPSAHSPDVGRRRWAPAWSGGPGRGRAPSTKVPS